MRGKAIRGFAPFFSQWGTPPSLHPAPLPGLRPGLPIVSRHGHGGLRLPSACTLGTHSPQGPLAWGALPIGVDATSPSLNLNPKRKVSNGAGEADEPAPSKFQVLTPKTEVASSNGQTGSYSGRECILFRFKAVCEDEMGASGRSFALLPWLGISWVQIAHGVHRGLPAGAFHCGGV